MKWNLKVLVAVLLLILRASQTRADIYEWAWVNPSDPTQGVVQSSVVCPGGGGVYAVPGAELRSLDLTQAYLLARIIHKFSDIERSLPTGGVSELGSR